LCKSKAVESQQLDSIGYCNKSEGHYELIASRSQGRLILIHRLDFAHTCHGGGEPEATKGCVAPPGVRKQGPSAFLHLFPPMLIMGVRESFMTSFGGVDSNVSFGNRRGENTHTPTQNEAAVINLFLVA
jgi:hypothetical protein